MSTLSSHDHISVLDLDFLESDPAPTFVIKISSRPIEFELLFCNEAFRAEGLREAVLATDRATILFRSWTQSVGLYKSRHEFGNRAWTAHVAGAKENWKIVRATTVISEKQREDEAKERANGEGPIWIGRSLMKKQSKDDFLQRMSHSLAMPLQKLPGTNLMARWNSLQTMMEMSDVGVFEYAPSGKLIHANDAWYRLSSHPRGPPALGDEADFNFMDLAYPDDQSLIMSAWNTLVQGNPVTFEMRWKGRPGSDQAAQWVLSSCVPVFDEDKKLISIAGNTIDINAQKKSQEVAQERIEALEQARLSERKFARFAQLAPVAIYVFKPGKGMQYVNDQFFELTGQPRVAFEQLEWNNFVAEEDVDKVQTAWSAMMAGKRTEHMQIRLKKTWINSEGMQSNIWVQGSSSPELDQDGNVVSIMGTLFDISQFKWAESVQRRRIEEALEAKRQQENFIDMTSHELRNPLSAVVQCADSVITTLQQLTPRQIAYIQSDIQQVNDEIAACIDSLQTIISCSLHQKRIIDDVLTLSKLDSNLLLITPMRVQTSKVISEALKMFEVECSQMDITLDFKQDDSLRGFEWVMLDPSRLLQILINLLTNAIKFTKDREVRRITVTLGAAWRRPSDEWQFITFAKKDDLPERHTCDKPEWGTGQQGYIWLKVDDTGCGMTNDEQKKLFSRFTQATPRTHIKYGGSGLGLFISKSLAALQGGSIGVNSTADVGSTFAFYVSTRIAEPPSSAESVKAAQPANGRTLSSEAAMKGASLNILMVEDNLVNQKVLRKQLQKVGCNVSVAGNGVEALEWLKRSVYWRGDSDTEMQAQEFPGLLAAGPNQKHTDIDPDQHPKHDIDIILMDIEMPVMDGLTCARLIRDYEQRGWLAPPSPQPQPPQPKRQLSASSVTPISPFYELNMEVDQLPAIRPAKRRLPILAVSANARSEQVEMALAAGMDDAISKPFRIPELWPKMEELVPRCAATES